MSNVNDLKESLEELNYPAIQGANFDNISIVEFSKFANWISKQLHFFAKTDAIVHVIKDDTQITSLSMELNSLFKEVGSIYSDSFSLTTASERMLMLYSLSGDLLAARLNYTRNQNGSESFSTELNPRKDLSLINGCLSISGNLHDTKSYFQKIKEKLGTNLLKLHEEDSLLLPGNKHLSSQQWAELKNLNDLFRRDYAIRREMLLRRADTTISSFGWKNDPSREIDQALLNDLYKKCRERMSVPPRITLANALAARSSDCNSLIHDVISTSHPSCLIPDVSGKANQGAQQQLQLHKFLMGSVPDRGGRVDDKPIPRKESFAQQNQHDFKGARRNARQGVPGGNYQRGNVAEQTNRVQNAGWQQGKQYNNYQQGGRGQNNYRQQDNYSQYQGGHQRFTGNGPMMQYQNEYGYHGSRGADGGSQYHF